MWDKKVRIRNVEADTSGTWESYSRRPEGPQEQEDERLWGEGKGG